MQPHLVSALAWPQNKGIVNGQLGIAMDTLLVGRIDGSVDRIDVIDNASYQRRRLQHCSRNEGEESSCDEILEVIDGLIIMVSVIITPWICARLQCLIHPGVRDKLRGSEINLSQPRHETAFL